LITHVNKAIEDRIADFAPSAQFKDAETQTDVEAYVQTVHTQTR